MTEDELTGDETPTPSLAPRITAALDRLTNGLTTSAGKNFVGLILYGGVARGRYRPGKSDVNVVVVLEDTSLISLSAVAPALRAAWKEARVEPFILTREEVVTAADVFPTRFLDIQQCHVVLGGENPFAELTVPRENIRLRVEQEFRNLQLRLRQRYIAVQDDLPGLTAALSRAAASLGIGLGTLLWLAGHEPEAGTPPAEGSTPAEVFGVAATAFDLDARLLHRLASVEDGAANLNSMQNLYAGTLVVVDQLAAIVDGLQSDGVME